MTISLQTTDIMNKILVLVKIINLNDTQINYINIFQKKSIS